MAVLLCPPCLQALADAIASWFVPVVTLIAAATFATWLGLGLSGRLNPELLPSGTTPLLLALLSAGEGARGGVCTARGAQRVCMACSSLQREALSLLLGTFWPAFTPPSSA